MKILVLSVSIQPPGGLNGLAAWSLQALREVHDVTLYTWHPVNLARTNAYYGTSLKPRDFRSLGPPWWARCLADALPWQPMTTLHRATLARAAHRLGRRYNVVMNLHNEMDLGVRGIQYIHYPHRPDDRPLATHAWLKNPILRFTLGLYRRTCRVLLGDPERGFRRNMTLVNSAWTQEQVRREYGIESTVVHPPACGRVSTASWTERENAFIWIGRLDGPKQLERAFTIIGAVRSLGHGVTLRVVASRERPQELRRAQQLVAASGGWAQLHLGLDREELGRLISRCRYGIHTMPFEHYGMGIAEMVQGGCIVFVPDSGGQVEIVNREPALCFATERDAVERIHTVLSDAALQERLRARLAAQIPHLGSDRFEKEMRNAVTMFADSRLR